tara:strand:+ start:19581 stop:19982 length:402 start_codon:yes stop_codon:yes gene_type:complete
MTSRPASRPIPARHLARPQFPAKRGPWFLHGGGHHLPRARCRAEVLIRRPRDGRLFMPHHRGLDAMIAGVLSPSADFWFVPARLTRLGWVAAIDFGWAPTDIREFHLVPLVDPIRVICVGKKAALQIEDGGLL